MKISRIGMKTNHNRGTEEALSQEILFQSAQLKRHSAGIYGLGHLLVKACNNILDVIRRRLESYDCAEISLPVMQSRVLWDKSGRWSTYTSKNKSMFTTIGRDGEYCMAPTAEEIVLDFIKSNIVSYKDLPINVFQIGNKYRDEIRVRGGLLRSKEFLMKDGYSFHASVEDMVREYECMKECYKKIFSDLELDVVSVKAVSGDMGGKVSEEFMFFSDIGEDKVLIDRENNIALNVEILDNPESLSELKNRMPTLNTNALEKVTCIELGHIFQLGKFYSESMDGYYVNKDNKREAYYMGCYGIGINRTLGAICEANCDSEGLSWPERISPYKCIIIQTSSMMDESKLLYSKLISQNVDVMLDDRDITLGSKIKDAKLLGFPYMIILGNNYSENKKIEVEQRKDSKKYNLDVNQLIEFLVLQKQGRNEYFLMP